MGQALELCKTSVAHTFGINGTLGRKDKREVVLTRYLRQALERFNPDHPNQVYDDAIARVVSTSEVICTDAPIFT